MNNFHNVNTKGWLEFPFEVSGYKFVSKVIPTYELLPLINAMGVEGFANINKQSIQQLGIIAGTLDEMASRLREINEHASECILEMVVA